MVSEAAGPTDPAAPGTPLAGATPEVVDATLPPPELGGGLALPLRYAERSGPWPRIAILLHLHYADLGEEMWNHLKTFPGPADLFITTNDENKRLTLAAQFAGWPHGSLEIRLVPNRGRDVAPRIIGLGEVHERYDLCLHLHGKRSLHWEHGAGWRGYLLGSLLGPGMVSGVVEAFRRCPRLGLAMPRNWQGIISSMSWGYDFDRARALGRRMGIEVDPQHLLEFPAGSMFWARRGALKPLLDLGLGIGDFEHEDGLPRGSVAHAIERLTLHICEKAGFDWLRFSGDGPVTPQFERAPSPAELRRIVARHRWHLTDRALNPPSGAADEMRLRFVPDLDERPRVTLLLADESMLPEHDPGGGAAVLGRLPLVAARRPVGVRLAGPASVRDRLPPELRAIPFVACDPGPLGIAAALPLGPADTLLATCWPGARTALRLRDEQAAFHGGSPTKVWFLPPGLAPADGELDDVASRAGEILVLSAPWSAPLAPGCETLDLPPVWDPVLPLPRGRDHGARAPLLLLDWQPDGDPGLRAMLVDALSACGSVPAVVLGDGSPLALPDGGSVPGARRSDPVERFRLLSAATMGLAPPWNGRSGRIGLEMSAFGLDVLGAASWPDDAGSLAARLRAMAAARPRPAPAPDSVPAPFVSATALDRLAADLARRAGGG